MDTADEWTELRRCTWLHEAHFLRSLLQSADIDVLIPDEHTAGVYPGITPMMGGVRVLVPAADLAHARELLAAIEADGS
jgi:hypothetical protein